VEPKAEISLPQAADLKALMEVLPRRLCRQVQRLYWFLVAKHLCRNQSQYDQSFILDVDKLGNVYVFGQTLGNYPITAGAWGTPQYRKQFIHKISNDLPLAQASTAFGSPSGA
jgi:hypothetical protein